MERDMRGRHLFRLIVMLACMIMMTAAVFAEYQNTDTDKDEIDGQFTFSNEEEKYGYESYLNSDHNCFVGARYYEVTIPDEGKLALEVSSDTITHMTMEVYSYETEQHVYEQDLVAQEGSGVKGTGETVALPAGKYHVTFMYTFVPNSSLRYDEAGQKFFTHYISWKKASYIRSSSISVSPESKTIYVGGSEFLSATVSPADAYYQKPDWTSSAPGIAEISKEGLLTAKAPGTAVITASTKDGSKATCTVTVKEVEPEKSEDTAEYSYDTEPSNDDDDYEGTEEIPAGTSIAISAGTVKVLSPSAKTVAFTKAKNTGKASVPASVIIDGKTYKVTQINAKAFTGSKIRTVTVGKNVKVIKKNAFKGSKATKVILKTKLLKKAKVKGCLKSSKVKTVQVKVGSKSQNKKYVKSYRKIFTKSNAGRKVKVK